MMLPPRLRSAVADSGWRVRFPVFLALFTAFNLLAYQWPLYRHAIAQSPLDSSAWAANLLMLTGLQIVLMIASLSLLSLLSLRLVKVICVLLLLGNALALYFMNTYQVFIDKAMMGNVFNTDRREATELFGPGILVYLLVLGVIPAVLVIKTRLLPMGRLRRLGILAASVVLGCGMIYLGSGTWLWFDQHAKQLGGLMLPWSYIANTARHFEDVAYANRPQTPLPPLQFEAAGAAPARTVVVLVIGESARSENFSLYGYGRPTNPALSRLGVAVLRDAVSCSTYTTASLRCMLSHLGSDAPARVTHEILPNYLQRHGVDVIWRSNNWGAPPLKIGTQQRLDDIRRTCRGNDCSRLQYDEGLLYGLRERLLASPAGRIFVVLHQTGSHGPQYAEKYPPAFERFTPVCRSVDVGSCSRQALINAYDNTVLYTDHVLAETIHLLQSLPDTASTLIYMSDHGESLGEQGFYLHGSPAAVAPRSQLAIPFLIWTSPTFDRDKASAVQAAAQHAGYTQDHVFHSVLGAFGAHSAVYKPAFDVFHPRRQQGSP